MKVTRENFEELLIKSAKQAVETKEGSLIITQAEVETLEFNTGSMCPEEFEEYLDDIKESSPLLHKLFLSLTGQKPSQK